MNKGKITQIIGAVVDMSFDTKHLPAVLNALVIEKSDKSKVYFEVAGHLGLGQVRSIAMSSTDGLSRGDEVRDTGAPISVPVGKQVLGRMTDVMGYAIDGKPEIKTSKKYSIHRGAPKF